MNDSNNSPAMTPQQEILTSDKSSRINFYKTLMVGKGSWVQFILFELITTLFSGLPGLLGYVSRSILYPLILKSCGKRPAIGKGVVLRCPASVEIGSKALIDDYVAIDARGEDSPIIIGDFVSIGRFSTITSKHGSIKLNQGVNVGSYVRIATQTSIEIGESTLIAAYAYIGPGNHQNSDSSKPLIAQEMELKGGVKIGKHCWIGAGAIILDGVELGDNVIVGAHSLVRESFPSGSVVAGTPAKIIKGSS